MSLEIVKVSPDAVRVRIVTAEPKQEREWLVDRRRFGSIGAISARADNGEKCTIGMFRTRDGSAILPEYARLRRLLAA
jgi:hypothetical protein